MPNEREYNQLKEAQTKGYKHGKAEALYIIPNATLTDRKFRKALSWAEANGEPLTLQLDDEYNLSLL